MAGIVIISLGHKNYYEMAVNLCASIKANGAQNPICLLHDGGMGNLSEDKQAIFDKNIIIDPKYYSKCPVEAKTYLYNLSPYDKTLYLDADMIILPGKNMDDFISSLSGIHFTIMNEISHFCIWADTDKLREYTQYEGEMLPIFYSELMYFEKGETAKKYFKMVQKCYKEIDFSNKVFAGGTADELAFICASLKMGVMPHKDEWLPIFWFFRDKKHRNLQTHQLGSHYIGYSAGGNSSNGIVKSSYNNLAAHYFSVIGLRNPYKLIDKRSYLKNRSTI